MDPRKERYLRASEAAGPVRWTWTISRWLLAHDISVFLAGLTLLCLVGWGMCDLRFSADNRDYFGRNNPEITAVKQMEDVYARADSLLFAFVGERDLCTPEHLTTLRTFTEEAWLLPDALRVDSIANFNHSFAASDDIIIEALLPVDAPIDEGKAAAARKTALNSNELVNRLIAPDCRALGLLIELTPMLGRDTERLEIVERARDMQAEWQERMPGVTVHLSGGAVADVSINEAARRDMVTLIPISFVVVSALMVLGLGSFLGWLGNLLVTAGGTIATLGFAGWIGVELIPATAISPLAVMVIVTASCVHLVMTWMRHLETGADQTEAACRAFEENLAAIAVANITTAVGFLCLNFAESPPLAQMGTIVAFGILFGWLLTALFLPLVFKRMRDFRVKPMRISPESLERLAAFGFRQPWIIPVFLIAILLSVVGISQIRFNDSALEYFDESYTFRTDSDAIEKALTGLESVHFSLNSGTDRSVFSPEFLRRVDRFADWLRQQDKVVFVGSVTDVIKRLNQTLHGGGAEGFRVADTQAANAQAMMLYELSLPLGQDMNQVLDIDRTQTRLSAMLRNADGRDIADFATRAEAWLAENEPQIATRAVGIGVAFSQITQRNNEAMLIGMFVVLVLVSAILVFVLRDLRLGLVSLIPNVLPAAFAFGLWGWFIGDVNLGSTVISTMTFGIVVDDTVHILMRYQQHRRAGADQEEALRRTFCTVGTALMVTSIAITSGFLVMILSGFVINQHIGGLAALVIILALATDLVLLPAILKRTRL